MVIHLDRDLEQLNRDILMLGGSVEEAINKSINSLFDRRPDLAQEVIEEDRDIDSREVDIENDCLKILALHQPVASDLRYIVAVLKVNNDLERMGDLAVNIANRALALAEMDPMDFPQEMADMADVVRQMVSKSLEALVNKDPDLALGVTWMDDQVNKNHRFMFDHLGDVMEEYPLLVRRAQHGMLVSRYLERIGDLAKNIGEDVVFMVEGEVIRHHFDEYEDESDG